MTITKIIRKFSLAAITIFVLLTSASAQPVGTVENISTYYPARPGIPLYDEDGDAHPGLPYTSFNNFTGNPNILDHPALGDEREFTVALYCPDIDGDGFDSDDDDTCLEEGFTYNTLALSGLKDGDRIRFEVYFHNNGADPYDEGGRTSDDARDVQIGIDLRNLGSPDYDFVLTPDGYIHSRDNIYKRANGEIITNDGEPVHKATDDVQLVLPQIDGEISLEPVPGSAWLFISDPSQLVGTDGKFHVTDRTPITFRTEKGNETIYVESRFTDDRMFLKFDRLPGCFRYSGFAYFDAVVKIKAPAVCEDLINMPTPLDTTINGERAIKFPGGGTALFSGGTFPQSILDSDGVIPMHWTTTDPEGIFYVKMLDNPPIFIPRGNSLVWGLHSDVYYIGEGNIHAEIAHDMAGTDITEEFANPDDCNFDYTIPEVQNICETIDKIVTWPTTLNGQQGYSLAAPEVTFKTGAIPEDLKFTWHTTDTNGRFAKLNNSNTFVSVNNSTAEELYNKAVFYRGAGTVTVTAKLPADEKLGTCNASVSYDQYVCLDLDASFEPALIRTPPNGEQEGHKLFVPRNQLSFTGGIPSDLDLVWTASEGTFYGSDRLGQPGVTGEIRFRYTEPVYYVGEGPVHVTAALNIEVPGGGEGMPDPALVITEACQDDLAFPEICEDIEVTHVPETIVAGETSSWTATAFDDEDGIFSENITYSVVSGKGYFTLYNNNLSVRGPGDLGAAENERGTGNVTDLGSIRIEGEEINYSEEATLENSNIPGTYQGPQSNSGPGVFTTPGVGSFTYNNVLSASDYGKTFSLQDMDVITDILETVSEVEIPRLQTITVAPGTTVYFHALEAGEDVITVKANNTDVEDCSEKFDIEPAPLVCDDLIVERPAVLAEQTLSRFRANAVTETGANFNQRITYTINEGYGLIYTEKPTNLPENSNPFVNTLPGQITFTENANAVGRLTATVNPGQPVFIWLEKDGENVIRVTTNNTTETDCSENFSIADVTPVCDSSTLKAYELIDALSHQRTEVDCLEDDGLYFFVTQYFDEEGNEIDQSKVKVLWTTTDPNGTFTRARGTTPREADETFAQQGNQFVGGGAVVYRGGGNVTAKLIEIDGEAVPADTDCFNTIEACEDELVCEDSTLTAYTLVGYFSGNLNNPVTTLEANTTYVLVTKYYQDAARTQQIPSTDVKVLWETTSPTGVFSKIGANPFLINPSDLYQFNLYPTKDRGIRSVLPTGRFNAMTSLETPVAEYAAITTTRISKPQTGTSIDPQLPADLDTPQISPDMIPSTGNDGIDPQLPVGINTREISPDMLPPTGEDNGLNPQLPADIDTPQISPNLLPPTQPASSNPGEDFVNGSVVIYRGGAQTGDVRATLLSINNVPEPADTDCADFLPGAEDVAICTNLTVTDNGTALGTLEKGHIYRLIALSSYDKTVETKTSTFTTTQGFFLPVPANIPGIETTYDVILTSLTPAQLSTANFQALKALYPTLSLLQQVTVPDGQKVYFVTFSDAAAGTALTVQATNRAEAACIRNFQIIEILEPCFSMSAVILPTPADGRFDPTRESLISVTGDFRDFNGNVRFGASGNGKFYKSLTENASSATNPKVVTLAEARAGLFFTGGTQGESVTITTEGNLASAACSLTLSSTAQVAECLDLTIVEPDRPWTSDDVESDGEQRFEVEVETRNASPLDFQYEWVVNGGSANWEGNGRTEVLDRDDGNPRVNTLEDIEADDDITVTVTAQTSSGADIAACSDTISLRSEEDFSPEITKGVYDFTKKEFRSLINIAGRDDDGAWLNPKHRWITYLSIFKPDGAETSWLWDAGINEYGDIESENFLDGTLEFNQIAIAIEKENGNKEVVYKSPGFDPAKYGNEDIDNDGKINDEDEFENWDEFEANDDGEEFFEDEYSCEGDHVSSNEFCIDVNSFGEVSRKFGKGEKLEFQNTENIEKIYILYQMENRTVIDEEACKDLTVTEGCGETFKNEINFEAELGNNEEEGQDEATVVVLCPFILTRQNGDVLFHSELDLSFVDTLYCAEVVNIEGVPITPDKVPRSTSTGGEEGATEEDTVEQYFSAPTHDVCKLSNDAGADIPEEFQNVFKSFSSSICEMETTVSEDWTEENIVSQIQANIEKIGRFGEVVSATPLNNMASVEQNFPESAQSGVYVVDGDLYIEGVNNEFIIKGTDILPAAQTYIVKGTLHINSNIAYDDSTVNPTDPKSFPSAAFIAEKIIFAEDVEDAAGIFMAVDINGDGTGGEINSDGTVTFEHPLTISGSLIGDIYDLFQKRRAVGDPRKNEGSITILYDERILLNTPPGLSELIDVNQLRVAQ